MGTLNFWAPWKWSFSFTSAVHKFFKSIYNENQYMDFVNEIFFLGHAQKSNLEIFEILGWECGLFLPFLQQWLTFYWACFWFRKSWKSIIKVGNSYHGAARCCGRKFCSEFFIQLFEHFCAAQAPLGQSLWSGYHWKDLFFLQKLSIDDGNLYQKWKKGKGLSQPVMPSLKKCCCLSREKNSRVDRGTVFQNISRCYFNW